MSRSGDAAGRVQRAYAWGRDGQIHYRRAGPAGARSPLLLLHDEGGSGAAFEAVMSEMGRERSVIAPDLPGTGMSDPVSGGSAECAQAMLDLVAELGLGIIDVLAVGESGTIALRIARLQPDVVRRIVLVCAKAPAAPPDQPLLALNLPEFPAGETAAPLAALRDFLDR